MPDQALFPLPTIAEVFGQAWNSGRLTFRDRLYLRSAILNSALSEEERAAIDRLLHAVRRGWLQILD